MDMLDENIREGYTAHGKPTSPCLTPENLEAFYSDRLASTRVEEVRAQLASCERCLDLSREYCEFWELSPASTPATQVEQPDGRSAVKAWRQYLLQPAWQFAAAAVLLIGVGVALTAVAADGRHAASPFTTFRVLAR